MREVLVFVGPGEDLPDEVEADDVDWGKSAGCTAVSRRSICGAIKSWDEAYNSRPQTTSKKTQQGDEVTSNSRTTATGLIGSSFFFLPLALAPPPADAEPAPPTPPSHSSRSSSSSSSSPNSPSSHSLPSVMPVMVVDMLSLLLRLRPEAAEDLRRGRPGCDMSRGCV